MGPFPRIFVLALAALAALAAAWAPSRLAPAPAAPAAAIAAGASRFTLQSSFWVSLHQSLIAAAQQGGVENPGQGGQEMEGWNGAVAAYAAHFAQRSPVFDAELVAINDRLAAAGEALPEGFAEPVRDALAAAAPVYRVRRWPSDDRANRFWIALADTLLLAAGEELVREHERVYGVAFPQRVLVDVAPYGSAYGAYTTGDAEAVHVTITSRAPAYQGIAALEMLFHEPSHGIVAGGGEVGVIGPEINAAARRQGLLVPRQLWHGVLFYTSGELTRRALLARGVDYTPYAYREGVYERAGPGVREALEEHWQAYLDGTIERQAAIEALVRATGRPRDPQR